MRQQMDFFRILRFTLTFLAKGLLATSGVVILACTFAEIFEGTISITELSILELLFIVTLCASAYRHCKNSTALGLKWHRILYLPLRNCGYLLLLALTALIFFIQQGNSLAELNAEMLANSIMEQLFSFGLILFCFYFATPRVHADQKLSVFGSERNMS